MTEPAPSAQPLIDTIETLITGAGVLFGEGKKPAGVTNRPYVVAWFDAGTITNRSLRSRDGFEVVGIFHSVGLTPEAARIAVAAVRQSALSLHRTVIAGRMVQMPEHAPAIPLSRDDDVEPPIYTQADEWRFVLSPA